MTITVPADLHELIQKHKHKFNISRECQIALRGRIDRLELAESGDLLAFLRSGKEQFSSEYHDTGRSAAREAVEQKEVSYEMFVELHRAVVALNFSDTDQKELNFLLEALQDNDTGLELIGVLDRWHGDSFGDDVTSSAMFKLGFLAELHAIFLDLRDKI